MRMHSGRNGRYLTRHCHIPGDYQKHTQDTTPPAHLKYFQTLETLNTGKNKQTLGRKLRFLAPSGRVYSSVYFLKSRREALKCCFYIYKRLKSGKFELLREYYFSKTSENPTLITHNCKHYI